MPTTSGQFSENDFSQLIDDLVEFVKIPSQSATSELKEQMEVAAKWLASKLESAGVENIEILNTAKHPTVYGDWLHAKDAPTVLIYGHYDVQPPEPLELWDSPPFKADLREGNLYGRGTADDKGGIICALHAVKSLLAADQNPKLNLKFCFEGEEEIGSPNLPGLIATEKERFSAALAISVDGGTWDDKRPQLLLGLRGTIAGELHVKGPTHDLHSGIYGGAVLNPLEALCRILSSMRDPNGRITIEGFYDDVVEFSTEARKAMNEIPDIDTLIKQGSGVEQLHGEPGYTPIEQTWIRPSLEINGISGGHSGSGPKTVIPAEAHAKLTCRLAPNQSPESIVSLIEAHVAEHTPCGVEAIFESESFGAKPYSLSRDHPAVGLLKHILSDVYGLEPYEVRVGGSVPIYAPFKEILGIDTISIGCATPNSNLHAPNEFVSVNSLRSCVLTLLKLFEELNQVLKP